MTLIDGKEVSKKVKDQIKNEIENNNYHPCLLVVIVGDDPASQIYVSSKEKACKKVGIESRTIALKAETTQEELIQVIKQANEDKNINGILIQLPLPKHIDSKVIIDAIDPSKDVDGLHVVNQGKLMLDLPGIVPCTPKGIMTMLREYNVDLTGKNVTVIGRSMLVGKPISLLMLQKNATVTMAHSKTKNLKEICLNSDVIVAAVGKPNLITEDMVKEGVIIVDVGINRLQDSIVGDVDFAAVSKKAYLITPVPGGVGPMTIVSLLENVLECYKKQNNIQ